MCHIVAVIKPQKIGTKIANLLVGSSYVAYERNSHMEGMYCNSEDSEEYSLKKTDFDSIYMNLADSTFALYHARLSTSGLGFNNVQPFVGDRFVFAHNGIYRIGIPYNEQMESDSRVVFNAFQRHAETKPVKEAYVAAIEETLSSDESFSTFIYDKETRMLHYTKSSMTAMTIYEQTKDDVTIFSTRPMQVFEDYANKTYNYDREKHVWLTVNTDTHEVTKDKIEYPAFAKRFAETFFPQYVSPKKNRSKKSSSNFVDTDIPFARTQLDALEDDWEMRDYYNSYYGHWR